MTPLFEQQPVISIHPGPGYSKQTKGRSGIAILSGAFILLILLILNTGCHKTDNNPPPTNYLQTNLVADVAGLGATIIDSSLVNAWGIAVAPSGPFWLTANHTGLSTIYDKNGVTLRPAVSIPAPGGSGIGAPTGIVFNSTTDFTIGDQPSRFIFATEDGTIAAWGAGNAATIMADRSTASAIYKGLALATDGADNFLYATNFFEGKIDVFDKAFHYVTGKPFMDPAMPAGFAPFNIRNISGNLYVTYAKQKPDKHDDEAGAGNGYVDIFKPDGSLVKRFTSQGALNSPWGIVPATPGFWKVDNTILIGNFGDGHISVFDQDGKFLGQLMNGGTPLAIYGLWALENNVPMADPNQLFFTAGPSEETHGLFGYVVKGH
ncbi:TIGR03118 family protein [Chitinophaga sp. MM2321]|uniref:TIGR03118 family protein n=1 Tax=Chitinophaga sp. MM2321 TaxID=3137178 RepID=UPI0032D5A78C